MAQVERKWIRDYAVNNQKIDPTDTYTITGLRVDATNLIGRVGVGISDPLDALHILRNDTSAGIILQLNDGSDGRAYQIYSDHSGGLNFRDYDSGGDRLTIRPFSGIGIDATSPLNTIHARATSGSSTLRLDLDDGVDGRAYGLVSDSDGAFKIVDFDAGSAVRLRISDAGTLTYYGDATFEENFQINGTVTVINTEVVIADQLEINQTDDQAALIVSQDNALATATVMRIENAGSGYALTVDRGYVGIGTLTPGAPLHVQGDIFLADGSNIGDPTHRIGTLYMASTVDYLTNLSFYSAGSSRVMFTTAGRVGIGSTVPTESLDVVGKIKNTTDIVAGGTLQGVALYIDTGPSILLGNVGIGLTSPSYQLHVNGAVVGETTISSVGLMTAGTGLSVTTGSIVVVTGGVSANTSVSAGTTVTAGTGITATTGNITASAGGMSASAQISTGTTIYAQGNITSNTGDIQANSGDIIALAGQLYGNTLLVSTGPSQLNNGVSIVSSGTGATLLINRVGLGTITYAIAASGGAYFTGTVAGDSVASISVGKKYHIGSASTGVPTMTYDSAGNAGIGTTIPTQKLHVVGNILATGSIAAGSLSVATFAISGATDVQVSITRTGGGNGVLINGVDGGLGTFGWTLPAGDCFTQSSTGKTYHIGSDDLGIPTMSFTPAGNVGIGTTTPSQKLFVVGNVELSGSTNVTHTITRTGGGSVIFGVTNGSGAFGWVDPVAGDSLIQFPDGKAFHIGFDAEPVPVVTINSVGDGRVGIGTASPLNTLHVNGSIVMSNGSLGTSSNPIGSIYFHSGINFTASSFAFLSAGFTRILVNSSGYVGINTSTPAYTLDVYGHGYVAGNFTIGGTLVKGGGSFRIDHPLNPDNKYLQHSFVESPEMRNLYYGQAKTINGHAIICLPEWWMALNGTDYCEFNYLLTPIGEWRELYISKEIENNRFEVSSLNGDCRFSWAISGIRHDTFAENNRVQVEVDKE